MQYLLDTVTLVRHFSGKGKLGDKAVRILDGLQESGDYLYISVISLMEIMYLAEKNRIEINLSKTLDLIQTSSQYSVIDLNPEILQVAETIAFPELHDRLILATAKWLGIKIISSDGEFEKVPEIEIVWD